VRDWLLAGLVARVCVQLGAQVERVDDAVMLREL
jgi:hypothetical protein